MEFSYVIQGYIIGFSVATTIGISGVLALQNMMTGRILVGLASAIAACLADAICAILVVFGLQAGQDVLLSYKTTLAVIAGVFLCGLGLRKIFGTVVLHSGHKQSGDVATAFGSVFFLALVDPVSIIDFMALCMGLTLDFSVVKHAIGFVLGLLAGSASWWLSICSLLFCFRQSLSVTTLQRIQQIVGTGIFGFGIWTLVHAGQ